MTRAPSPPGQPPALALTPSQTVGPFFAICLPWPDGQHVVPGQTPGAIAITGRVLDGAGDPVPDAIIETWQAAPDGSFTHPDDPRGPADGSAGGSGGGGADGSAGGNGGTGPAFRGFGRCPTGPDGEYRIVTLRPSALPCGDGQVQAPHLDVSVFARGLLDRVVTRMYFPDEEAANAADPVLASITERDRRATLIAAPGNPGGLRFDIRLQGPGETVFFDV